MELHELRDHLHKLWRAYQRFDKSDEARLLLVFVSCICAGIALATLDSMKNIIIIARSYQEIEDFFLYAPLWNISYTPAQLWDICLLLVAFSFGVALVTVWNLGKRAGKRES